MYSRLHIFFVINLDHSFFPGFPSGGVGGGGLQGRSDGSGESSLMNRDPNLLLWVIRGLGVHLFLIFFFTFGCFSTDPKVVAEACSSRVLSFALKSLMYLFHHHLLCMEWNQIHRYFYLILCPRRI